MDELKGLIVFKLPHTPPQQFDPVLLLGTPFGEGVDDIIFPCIKVFDAVM
jgi:hypothetical protein